MKNLAPFGRYFFASGVMASGTQQLITAEFVRLVPKLSPGTPWPSLWAYLVGAILVVLGAATLLGRLCGGAILLAGTSFGDDAPALEWARKLRPLATVLLAIFLTICGIQHFVYSDFVTSMVPAWMPGVRFWTYFTGTALIAGGLGLVVPKTRRLAASLSGLMVFLWVWMVHIPRAVADLHNASEMSGVFEALALSGVALLVAGLGSERATPGQAD